MSRLRPEKLHVTFAPDTGTRDPIVPRAYTLTHSDRTGDLFLTIGSMHDKTQIAGLYTRFMRDEVLAEWTETTKGLALHVDCHVSGLRPTFGSARTRIAIFKRELPLVLEALRYGDRHCFAAHRELDHSPILVRFHARQERYNRVEPYGVPADYAPRHITRRPS